IVDTKKTNTLSNIDEAVTTGKGTSTKHDISIYDLSESNVKSASLIDDEIFSIVFGKINEDENSNALMTIRMIYNTNKITFENAMKVIYSFNSLIENPGFLI